MDARYTPVDYSTSTYCTLRRTLVANAPITYSGPRNASITGLLNNATPTTVYTRYSVVGGTVPLNTEGIRTALDGPYHTEARYQRHGWWIRGLERRSQATESHVGAFFWRQNFQIEFSSIDRSCVRKFSLNLPLSTMCVSLRRALSTQNECTHHRLETVANHGDVRKGHAASCSQGTKTEANREEARADLDTRNKQVQTKQSQWEQYCL